MKFEDLTLLLEDQNDTRLLILLELIQSVIDIANQNNQLAKLANSAFVLSKQKIRLLKHEVKSDGNHKIYLFWIDKPYSELCFNLKGKNRLNYPFE